MRWFDEPESQSDDLKQLTGEKRGAHEACAKRRGSPVRRLLARLLRAFEEGKPPKEPLRHEQEIVHVPHTPANVEHILEEAALEAARQHWASIQSDDTPPPLPPPHQDVEATLSLPESPPLPPGRRPDPRLVALCEAGSPEGRRSVAAHYPELRPPHACLTERENAVLEWSYWQGLSDDMVTQRLGGKASSYAVRNRALCKLAKHLASKAPGQASSDAARPREEGMAKVAPAPVQVVPLPSDPRLVELKLASTAKRRQEAALRHPELRPPHDTLTDREDKLLELAYWQGLTYKEVGKHFGLSADRPRQLCNRALHKLDYHLRHGGSLGERPPSFKEMIRAFRTARSASRRMRVAERFPQVRPPHPFLLEQENGVLERYYWHGETFSAIGTQLGLTQKEARKLRDEGLRKLERHHRREKEKEKRASAQPVKNRDRPPGEVGASPPSIVLGQDMRVRALLQTVRAASVKDRRAVAHRYRDLRPPHACLSEAQNELLEGAFWQARPFEEIAQRTRLSRSELSASLCGVLETLNSHLCGDQNEDHLSEVLLALNECGSVRRAARKLGAPRDVLKAFMKRQGIKMRTVYEVED